MTHASKLKTLNAIHSINSESLLELEQLINTGNAIGVLRGAITDSIPAHRNALGLVEQAAANVADEDLRHMVQFKQFVQHGIDKGLPFKISIYRGVTDEGGKAVNYLIYASENTADLKAMIDGHRLYFSGVIKFLN